MRKITIQQAREHIKQQGYLLLSGDYKNAHIKLSILCDKGHQHQMTWANFQQGQRCPHCAGKIVSYRQVRNYVREQGYILLSREYKNNRTKLDIQCCKGHQYRVTWNKFRQGHRCPTCFEEQRGDSFRLSLEQVRNYIKQQGYALLSSKYKNCKTKLDIRCNEGHQYQATWNDFKTGYRCPYCAGKIVILQQIADYIEHQGHLLLSKKYKNSATKLSIRCEKGHKYKIAWDNFRQGCRCPICSESKGEKKVAQILTSLGFNFVRQHRLNKSKLKLDFFIPSLNVGIEYDGQHHFKPIRFGGMSIEKAQRNFFRQQERDAQKNKLCKQNNYNLIRIAYGENLSARSLSKKISAASERNRI